MLAIPPSAKSERQGVVAVVCGRCAKLNKNIPIPMGRTCSGAGAPSSAGFPLIKTTGQPTKPTHSLRFAGGAPL